MKFFLIFTLFVLSLSASNLQEDYAKATAVQKQPKHTKVKRFYVGGGVNFNNGVAGTSLGVGVNAKFGIFLENLLHHLSFELDTSYSLKDPKTSAGVDENLFTLGTYLAYTICLGDSGFAVRPRFGMVFANLSTSVNSTDVAISSGAALLYALDSTIILYADYTDLGEQYNNYTLGVEYKF